MHIDASYIDFACGSGPACPSAHSTDTGRWLMQGPTVPATSHPELVVPGHEGLVEVTPTVIDMIRKQPFMDVDQLGDWIVGNHRNDVFRLETLDRYSVESDEADFQAYMAGAPAPDRDAKQGWLDFLADSTAHGRTWRRVHIIKNVTDYIRFEAEWCYTDNTDAGEDIRIIDLSTTTVSLDLLQLDDFYLVDDKAAVLGYDADGSYLYALPVTNTTRLAEARDLLWDAAEPFASWWGRHPEHHRSHRRAA